MIYTKTKLPSYLHYAHEFSQEISWCNCYVSKHVLLGYHNNQLNCASIIHLFINSHRPSLFQHCKQQWHRLQASRNQLLCTHQTRSKATLHCLCCCFKIQAKCIPQFQPGKGMWRTAFRWDLRLNASYLRQVRLFQKKRFIKVFSKYFSSNSNSLSQQRTLPKPAFLNVQDINFADTFA